MLNNSENESACYNEGKPRLGLIPPDWVLGLAKVLTEGAKKYEADNWKKSIHTEQNKAFTKKRVESAYRHLLAIMSDEYLDPETGLPHALHLAVNACMVATYQEARELFCTTEGDPPVSEETLPLSGKELEVQLAEQLKDVRWNGYSIGSIKNPCLEVQLAAVNQNGYAIKYIGSPCLEVQLAALKKNGYAISLIGNPCLEVKLEAVNQNGYAIQFIKDPCLEVQLAAVNQNGYAIQFIDSPRLEVQLAAVNQHGYSIQFIKDPFLEAQFAAVKRCGYAIKYIDSPCLEVQLAAVKQNECAIRYIDTPDPNVVRYVREK